MNVSSFIIRQWFDALLSVYGCCDSLLWVIFYRVLRSKSKNRCLYVIMVHALMCFHYCVLSCVFRLSATYFDLSGLGCEHYIGNDNFIVTFLVTLHSGGVRGPRDPRKLCSFLYLTENLS